MAAEPNLRSVAELWGVTDQQFAEECAAFCSQREISQRLLTGPLCGRHVLALAECLPHGSALREALQSASLDTPEEEEFARGIGLPGGALVPRSRKPAVELDDSLVEWDEQAVGGPLLDSESFTAGEQTVSLQNVVATADLGGPLDPVLIAERIAEAEYEPKRFAAVILRIDAPRATALVFPSGKIVCTGPKSERSAQWALQRFGHVLRHKVGINVTLSDFKIQNIVGSFDIQERLNLQDMAASCDNISYEPQLFPGAIYRLHVPKIVFLVFMSGKVVGTGA
eukprot:CAMPEP_0114606524 /NCGR_PEP_ID=MMETSP0168-20121206/1608_1 /TAXON_ID=95228 ORGANISM="Vannella sp., Strain DIVA3 517/6/12" /NCGR_SAMPLE_ID=MMETSP0168 /ASSEMBLY_ACC=CAM_ASM_000044 /LENGTH=281 /DNA_ID=CAMNT_0001817395 /DNA_START=30 /DNA_END=872 /DNA_ORIENTATION=-